MTVSREEISKELIADIKLDLGITWEDEATDKKIRGLVARGMVYLNDKLGDDDADPMDYEGETEERSLLFEYVRYARDAALDVFENNYMSMILAAQHNRQVKNYVESTEQAEA